MHSILIEPANYSGMTATLCLPFRTYHPIMWWVRRPKEPQSEILRLKALAFATAALEDNAVRAGAALGCSYANSHEYEAELISARRAAGIYGRKGQPWKTRLAAIAAGLAVVVALILLVT